MLVAFKNISANVSHLLSLAIFQRTCLLSNVQLIHEKATVGIVKTSEPMLDLKLWKKTGSAS